MIGKRISTAKLKTRKRLKLKRINVIFTIIFAILILMSSFGFTGVTGDDKLGPEVTDQNDTLPPLQSSISKGSALTSQFTRSGGHRDPAETCTVIGYVNNTMGFPLQNAKVKIVDSTSNNNETNADAAGRYEIQVIPGQTKLTAFYPGYRGQNTTINAASGINKYINFTLALLEPELATIKGYVNSTLGPPIESAIIYLTDIESWENATVTDINGYYEIHCVNGSLLQAAIMDGYNFGIKYPTVVDYQVLTVNFKLTPIPEPTAVIKGYVQLEAGDPVANIDVAVHNKTHQFNNQTTTDSSGYYELGVIEDWITVYIDETGYFVFYDNFFVNDFTTLWYNITLYETGPRTASLSGTVVAKGIGDPIEGAEVKAELEEYNWEASVKTDANGEYQIDLYRGNYSIQVTAPGYFDENFELEVDVGESVEENIELEPTPPESSMIKGYIRDDQNNLIDADIVFAFDMNNDTRRWNTTTNGYFEIPVWGAKFLVVAILQGYSMSGENVLVTANSVVWANLTMYESTAIVCGYVKNTDGEPLEEAAVNLMDDKSINLGGYTTDEDGYFEVPTHPGAFILLAKGEDDGFLNSGEYDTYIDELVVTADTKIWANVTLQEAGLATMAISITFSDWDHITQEGRSSMTFNQTCETRLFFDSYVGNGDLSLNQAELAEITEFLLEDILEEEDDDDESGFFDKNTTDRFFIDDVYYLLDEDTVVMEFNGLVGAWDAKNDGEMTFSSEYTSHTTIVNSLTHDLDINQSWRIPDKNEEMELSLNFPTGYGAIDWEVVANISMNGSNPWVIVPGANPNPGYHDEDEDKIEGVDYIWAHTFVNRTYDIVDNSDVKGFCGEKLNFSLEITEWVVVKSVSLEYRLLGEPNFNKVTPENSFGTYTYNLSIPQNEEQDLDYRFIIEITPDFKLTVPHRGTKSIEVVDGIDPTVILEPPPKWVNIGTIVTFDAAGSYDNIGITSYNFSFGDGSYHKSSSASAEHTYNNEGVFEMVVEVTDQAGNGASTSFELNVVNDKIAPEVLSTVPEGGAVDVDPATSIEVIFSEDMDAITIDIELAGIGYDYSYNNTDNYTLKIDVDGSLAWGTQYIITLSAADLVGNWLNGYKFNFTIITFDKYDNDGDGVPNGDDAFPDDPTGAMDTDEDGKPDELLNATGWNGTLIEDLDDDNDNWTDELELRYDTDPKDPSEFPADLDGDHIPDIDDPDIDGDGVPNNKDDDPYDPTVGEKDEDDYLWAIIAVVVIVIVIVVLIVFLLFLRPRFMKRGQEQPMAQQPSKPSDGPPGPVPGPGQPQLARPVVGPPPTQPSEVPRVEGQPAMAQPVAQPKVGLPPATPRVVPRLGAYKPGTEPELKDASIVEDNDDEELETF